MEPVGGHPMTISRAAEQQGGEKDERKATQLAECMQLLAEYFCCCVALRRGRMGALIRFAAVCPMVPTAGGAWADNRRRVA